MQWLAENWFLVLLGGGMVAMHLFGHGHGGHGGPKKSAGDTNAVSAAVPTDLMNKTFKPEEDKR